MVSGTDNILIFDRELLRQKRARVATSLNAHRFLIDWADEKLTDRLADIKREFPLSLTIKGDRTFSMGGRDIIADEEFLPAKPGSLDLVLSNLNLHSINDLPGTLLQIRNSLKPDGLFLSAMFGGETLFELRDSLMQTEIALKGGASPRVFPFADKQQMGALLQRAGFALPVVDSEIITVTYDDMFRLLHDLRGMGETNIIKNRSRINPGREFFLDAAKHYAEHHSDEDGRIRASFEIIFLIGWAPHESQQKPLSPGSAQTRLADALSTDEIKTGVSTNTKGTAS